MICPEFNVSRMMSTLWLLAALVILVPSSGLAQAYREKEKLQQTKKKLEDEIRYTTEMLEKTKKSRESSVNRINILNRQIRSREALIRTINRELDEVQVTMIADSIRIGRMSKQLQAMRSEYARMIAYAYRMMNGRSRLMFIFSAKDFNQAYIRLRYYQQYAAYRRRQADKIDATRKAIDAHRRELEEVKMQKTTLVQSKQTEKQKLDREKDEKAASVRELSSKEKQLMATLKAKQDAARRLENAIEKLIADEIRAADARKAKSEVKTGTAGKSRPEGSMMDFTPAEKELSASFSANRGKLPWPCDRGFVSSDFGEHVHPVLEHVKVKNNGIDITTEQGSVVKAVFGGKVSRVMSLAGLNQVVIIRHGEYLTVYSNLGEVSVRDGQEVAIRQVIGKAYAAPGDPKSELHFELWHGKVIQDPEIWLAGR